MFWLQHLMNVLRMDLHVASLSSYHNQLCLNANKHQNWSCLGIGKTTTPYCFKFLFPPWNYHSPWKRMVGILVLLSYWRGLFSGAMLNFGEGRYLLFTNFETQRYPRISGTIQKPSQHQKDHPQKNYHPPESLKWAMKRAGLLVAFAGLEGMKYYPSYVGIIWDYNN